ncbi:hypothetical protein [Sphingomonas sp.]|uniref:hypothetical protein n=1 Tax=Sphingomonas sp. TaxID=28214 RepID=UPI0035A86FD4
MTVAPPSSPVSSPPRVHRLIAGGLLSLWALSLALPVAVIREGDIWQGWMVLAFGFLGILNGQFGWLANWVFLPATFAGMVLRRPSRRLLVTVLVLLVPLVAGTMAWREVVYDDGVHAVMRFGPGYFLWLAAMTGCVVWQAVRVVR